VDIRIKPGQPLAYLRRAPTWLVLLASHDQHLDPDRQLIGMPVRSPRAGGAPTKIRVIIIAESAALERPGQQSSKIERCVIAPRRSNSAHLRQPWRAISEFAIAANFGPVFDRTRWIVRYCG
jgi:hypothetical protein